MWRLEAGGVLFGRTPWEEEEGKRCADLNFFAEFRSRSVSLNCCTCLLFIFEVRRRGVEGERMVGESHTFPCVRVLLYSP